MGLARGPGAPSCGRARQAPWQWAIPLAGPRTWPTDWASCSDGGRLRWSGCQAELTHLVSGWPALKYASRSAVLGLTLWAGIHSVEDIVWSEHFLGVCLLHWSAPTHLFNAWISVSMRTWPVWGVHFHTSNCPLVSPGHLSLEVRGKHKCTSALQLLPLYY